MTLPARFREPDGLKWGYFSNGKGARLRYASLAPEGVPKGAIVISPGLREMAEKYVEVMRDFAERGYAVFAIDHRGQGGSERFAKVPRQRIHSEGYDEYVSSLDQFVKLVVAKTPGPKFLMAHSMGAHIGLRYLKEHPGVFDSAVMTSPMCDVVTKGYPRPFAVLLAKFARIAGKGKSYIPKGHDWDEKADDVYEGNPYTSDYERFKVRGEIFHAKPELRMGQPTFGWLAQTFNSISKVSKPAYLESIKTPILMAIAGQDDIVVKEASERAAGLLPHCTRVDFPEAKHELWMERDAFRKPLLDMVTGFLAERVKRASAPAIRPQRAP